MTARMLVSGWKESHLPGPASDLALLSALGRAGSQVACVEQPGDDHPEPLPAREPDARRVEDHVHQRSERKEDDPEQRPDPRGESAIDQGRPGYPDDEQ